MAADCSAMALCTQTQLQSRMLQRKCFIWKDGVTCIALPHKASPLVNSAAVRLLSGSPNRNSFSRCCMGSLLNAQNISPLSWVSNVDQLLLITTVAFAYMAGAVPQNATYRIKWRRNIGSADDASDVNISGRCPNPENSTDARYPWMQVEKKLLDALDTVNRDSNLLEREIKWDSFNKKCPFSLLAIKGGSRLRLLHATLRRLHKEVASISQVHEGADRETRLEIFLTIVQGSVQPIFLNWLEEELSMLKRVREKELIYGAARKLETDDSVLQKIKFMEKADLYGDALFFLRFRSHSSGYYYDDCILMQHEMEILEDLVITLADGICSVYLELISLDSTLSPEVNCIGSSLCSLSTRTLQKLRNQAALNQWLIQNFESVTSMYEDRFDLFVLTRKTLEESDADVAGTSKFWSTFFRKQLPAASLDYLIITEFPIFVKRTKELKALAGWRYYYSLFLELSDIAMPLINAAFVRARNAISFFLTCLIGRSLGLIYSGIRQSLSWR